MNATLSTDRTHRFSDPTIARAFLLAGAARFTLVSKRTGERFTFRIAKAKVDEYKYGEEAPYFVSVLTGPSNSSDFTFLGTIFSDGYYARGKKGRPYCEGPSARAFAWFWLRLRAGELPASCEVWHEGRCGRCGRALTVPESIASGIGPTCAEAE